MKDLSNEMTVHQMFEILSKKLDPKEIFTLCEMWDDGRLETLFTGESESDERCLLHKVSQSKDW